MFGKMFNWNKPNKGSASAAKERLQIIVSHQGKNNDQQDASNYVEKLQSELISVIAKYVKVTEDQVKVTLENSGKSSVLELNVTLPEN
ncbi:MAG: cell division topological specificity factor MinE [Pseudomonadota bacterium]|nr:cell division topological specificity factor MinE [Pseudomonadota bacterium]